MNVDLHIKYTVYDDEQMETPKVIEKILPKINIGRIPIMVKSSCCILTQNKFIHPNLTEECFMDCGGYFIIKGSEKTVLAQERVAETESIVLTTKIHQNGLIVTESNPSRTLNVFPQSNLRL